MSGYDLIFIQLIMKILLLTLLVVALTSAGSPWHTVSYLPSVYTGLPFSLELGNGNTVYTYIANDLPSFAVIDGKKGVIVGKSDRAGAHPVSIKVINSQGESVRRQYILNVIDTNSAEKSIWADKTGNYYSRVDSKPFRIAASSTHKTYTVVGQSYSTSFNAINAAGRPVYAFLNLPDGLDGDSTKGTITGSFAAAGIYTIAVTSVDQSGKSAEGFITITVGEKAGRVASVGSLQKVTVANKVQFVYDIVALQLQQTQADKNLFAALAVVNSAKAQAAAKQAVFDRNLVKLNAAEAAADKAAATAARANTDRQNAANRLSQTNKALNHAEDNLNLALLHQAAAQASVKKAVQNLNIAQTKFDDAQNRLNAAEKALQAAQEIVNTKKLAQIHANTNLKNAQRDYNRANEDLNDAKNKYNAAQEAQQRAADDLTRAKNDLSLATQGYNQAAALLKKAIDQLLSAEAARQAALAVLQSAIQANQRASTILGAAQWNLSQAIAALNVANAAKDAADRTTALVIANGVPQSLQKVDFEATFSTCDNNQLPRYSGSVKIVSTHGDRAVIATGNTILVGNCTQGKERLVAGATVTIIGAINPRTRCIQAHKLAPVIIKA